MRARGLRFVVGVLTVVAAAWFVLGIRQAHDTTSAAAFLTGTTRLPAAQARHVSGLLRSAGQLNPDTQVDVLRGELALGQGDRVAARAILERVVAQEPDNALAWEWLARAAVGDLREFYVAAYQIRQLVPPVR